MFLVALVQSICDMSWGAGLFFSVVAICTMLLVSRLLDDLAKVAQWALQTVDRISIAYSKPATVSMNIDNQALAKEVVKRMKRDV